MVEAGYVGGELLACASSPVEGADQGWWWWMAKIARGEYPLEKLPEHVREPARELY